MHVRSIAPSPRTMIDTFNRILGAIEHALSSSFECSRLMCGHYLRTGENDIFRDHNHTIPVVRGWVFVTYALKRKGY